jgi:RNA polymerase sigma-70 factor (ECF subfamily)
LTRPDAETEEEVLRALEQGDLRRAITILMDAYGTALYRFCRATLGDATAAEDALQTIFLEAYESLPRFGRRSSLLTWLLGIARHRCLDAARARRRWVRRFLYTTFGDPPDPRPAADQSLGERARRTLMLDCLKELSADARLAVVLRCQQGLTFEDMARMSGERAGTLQARVARSLVVLRGCVEGKEATS